MWYNVKCFVLVESGFNSMAGKELPPKERFSLNAQRVVIQADAEARNFHHDHVGTEHLVMAMLHINCTATQLLVKFQITDQDLRLRIEALTASENGGIAENKPGKLPITPRLAKVLELAVVEAMEGGYEKATSAHLLLAVLRDEEGLGAIVLRQRGVIYPKIKDLVPNRKPPEDKNAQSSSSGNEGIGELPNDLPDIDADENAMGDVELQQAMQNAKSATPALDTFGRDLTALARVGKLDPVVGRTKESRRVIQIICRRSKNNAVLIGEAGVGKTAVVEGLAQAIADGDVPERMQGMRVVSLDMALMVAGTKYRGQFEERLKMVLDEVTRQKKIILFLDEIHTIVGAGGAEGAMDAANIIKPALARGELQCIGATTLSEYRKGIENDAALERRFQMVLVEEPSIEDTIQILKGVAPRYENHHVVHYTEAALEAAARLTARYQPGRQLPDKAIDAIDEAAAFARMTKATRPAEIKKLEKQLRKTQRIKDEWIAKNDFDKAAELRDQELKETETLEAVLTEWRQAHEQQVITIDENQIAETVAAITGVPVKQLTEGERKRLLDMEKTLCEQVVGQAEAVKVISRSLRRARSGLKDPKRPIGSFIFLGPTGVGKTLLAKTLAQTMFGDEKALIQLDMSEYMEKFSISRLVGSPPGYVGHEEGGQLTERVRRKPYSVVLFDEIEKAHPDVTYMLLQILEEGRLTDSLGRNIDFKNTIVILTTNLGCDFGNDTPALGFVPGKQGVALPYETLKAQILREAKKLFKPELLNRFDELIVFRALGREEIEQILTLELAKLQARIKSEAITLKVTPKAIEFLIEKSLHLEQGARPVRRAIEQYVEDPLSDLCLQESCHGKTVRIAPLTDGSALKATVVTHA